VIKDECIMQKTKQTGPKLLVIVITTAAIIAVTTTISISAAIPAFAKVNCKGSSSSILACSGGASAKKAGTDVPGGFGEGIVSDQGFLVSSSGGLGQHSGEGGIDGGFGRHSDCDPFSLSKRRWLRPTSKITD
jgi:hypothetical protein